MSKSKPDAAPIVLTRNDANATVALVGDAEVATVQELAGAASIDGLESLAAYCDAVNYLQFGGAYSVIHDPAAFAAKYQQRLAAEDPNAPWEEGVRRLSDFGVCDTSLIQPPQQALGTLTFYAEDNRLGIPYRVTAPAPGHPGLEVRYEPLPMTPLPPPPSQVEEAIPETAEVEPPPVALAPPVAAVPVP